MAFYDCGSGSVLIISNTSIDSSGPYFFNGFSGALGPARVLNLPCKGNIDTGYLYTNVSFKVVPSVSTIPDYSLPFSFLAGLLVALCFVIISIKRW